MQKVNVLQARGEYPIAVPTAPFFLGQLKAQVYFLAEAVEQCALRDKRPSLSADRSRAKQDRQGCTTHRAHAHREEMARSAVHERKASRPIADVWLSANSNYDSRTIITAVGASR